MDSIGQFASMLSGLGQAQAAAPAQPVVAPTLVPAQPSYAAAYTAPVAVPVAPPVVFRAMALSWNPGGGWAVRTSPTLADATVDALRSCNSQFGGCVLSDAAVPPTAFGCLVVAQGADEPTRLFAAVGSTPELARGSVETQLINAAVRGQVAYSGCNNS